MGLEDEEIKDNFDGTEDWDRWRDQTVEWMGHGQRIQSIALLYDKGALQEYKGGDSDRVMQWISENLDLDCSNAFMISDLANLVDEWVLSEFSADEVLAKVLLTLDDYIGGC